MIGCHAVCNRMYNNSTQEVNPIFTLPTPIHSLIMATVPNFRHPDTIPYGFCFSPELQIMYTYGLDDVLNACYIYCDILCHTYWDNNNLLSQLSASFSIFIKPVLYKYYHPPKP